MTGADQAEDNIVFRHFHQHEMRKKIGDLPVGPYIPAIRQPAFRRLEGAPIRAKLLHRIIDFNR
ncbi:ubiquitin-protein ligase [Tepidicaulis marinus]|uniref:Ubiquitin-protein ligase n=1 Tax=Tepidicaulis marinus TaxID=1333998 RepID=A0A081B8J5_9HYPH|nr:ubiquitin-protein ligase [Tepidicaulis marinus]